MNNYKVVDTSQISREKWQEFTDNNENCNIFYTLCMYDVLNTDDKSKYMIFGN